IASMLNKWMTAPNLSESPVFSLPERPLPAIIPDQQRDSYSRDLAELLAGCEETGEILEAAFKAQHVGIELPGRAIDPPLLQRLEFGVPINYLWGLVRERCRIATPCDFHFSFDTLIDKGIIVPRFLPTGCESTDLW